METWSNVFTDGQMRETASVAFECSVRIRDETSRTRARFTVLLIRKQKVTTWNKLQLLVENQRLDKKL